MCAKKERSKWEEHIAEAEEQANKVGHKRQKAKRVGGANLTLDHDDDFFGEKRREKRGIEGQVHSSSIALETERSAKGKSIRSEEKKDTESQKSEREHKKDTSTWLFLYSVVCFGSREKLE